MANPIKVISGAAKAAKKIAKNKSVNKPKITAKARGFSTTKSGRKEMKQQDVYYNQLGKSHLRSGKLTDVAQANTPRSNSKALTPKVPAKKK